MLLYLLRGLRFNLFHLRHTKVYIFPQDFVLFNKTLLSFSHRQQVSTLNATLKLKFPHPPVKGPTIILSKELSSILMSPHM